MAETFARGREAARAAGEEVTATARQRLAWLRSRGLQETDTKVVAAQAELSLIERATEAELDALEKANENAQLTLRRRDGGEDGEESEPQEPGAQIETLQHPNQLLRELLLSQKCCAPLTTPSDVQGDELCRLELQGEQHGSSDMLSDAVPRGCGSHAGFGGAMDALPPSGEVGELYGVDPSYEDSFLMTTEEEQQLPLLAHATTYAEQSRVRECQWHEHGSDSSVHRRAGESSWNVDVGSLLTNEALEPSLPGMLSHEHESPFSAVFHFGMLSREAPLGSNGRRAERLPSAKGRRSASSSSSASASPGSSSSPSPALKPTADPIDGPPPPTGDAAKQTHPVEALPSPAEQTAKRALGTCVAVPQLTTNIACGLVLAGKRGGTRAFTVADGSRCNLEGQGGTIPVGAVDGTEARVPVSWAPTPDPQRDPPLEIYLDPPRDVLGDAPQDPPPDAPRDDSGSEAEMGGEAAGKGAPGDHPSRALWRKGDLVEFQEGLKPTSLGNRQWYTGIIAYSWFEDRSSWDGYAIQLILSTDLETSLAPRIPAKRVRAVGGAQPFASDAHLVSETLKLAARQIAMTAQVGSPPDGFRRRRPPANRDLSSERPRGAPEEALVSDHLFSDGGSSSKRLAHSLHLNDKPPFKVARLVS